MYAFFKIELKRLVEDTVSIVNGNGTPLSILYLIGTDMVARCIRLEVRITVFVNLVLFLPNLGKGKVSRLGVRNLTVY